MERSEISDQSVHHRDPLTGLYTHNTFLSLLSQLLSRTTPSSPVGILYMEFDDLARFNDTFGFDIDDRLLVALSTEIKKLLKDQLFGRVGTYRYAIAVENAEDQQLQLLAEQIIHLLSEPFNIDENMFYITATIGISLSKKKSCNAYTLLKYAENTMKRLQKEGTNHIGFHKEEKNPLLKEDLRLMRDLPGAIDAGEFYFVYQPQYSHKKASFTGAEILTRWRHPELGEISPARFIPLAEKTGMITPLTIQILIEASKMFDALSKIGQEKFSLAVNISPQVLMEKSFLETIQFIVEQYELKGKNLTFEIMEDTLPNNLDKFITLLQNIRKMGITIAIDDYGTGHTSLKYLMTLPVDYLKIDRSFVKDIHHDKRTFKLFKTIIDIARTLNLKVIAEGVEVEEEDQILRKLNNITVQGYLYAKPLQAETLLELKKKSSWYGMFQSRFDRFFVKGFTDIHIKKILPLFLFLFIP
jgi:diguanylate cyclase (GGDEF)-like protein